MEVWRRYDSFERLGFTIDYHGTTVEKPEKEKMTNPDNEEHTVITKESVETVHNTVVEASKPLIVEVNKAMNDNQYFINFFLIVYF